MTNATITTAKNLRKLEDEWRALNLQISSHLKSAGKPLNEMPDSEWKNWITELMQYRDSLTNLF